MNQTFRKYLLRAYPVPNTLRELGTQQQRQRTKIPVLLESAFKCGKTDKKTVSSQLGTRSDHSNCYKERKMTRGDGGLRGREQALE